MSVLEPRIALTPPFAALLKALKVAGGPTALSRQIGVTSQAIGQWKRVPPLRVLAVETATGIPRHELRPDLYPAPAVVNEGAAA